MPKSLLLEEQQLHYLIYGMGDTEFILSQEYSSESEHNGTTGVWTHLLQCCRPAHNYSYLILICFQSVKGYQVFLSNTNHHHHYHHHHVVPLARTSLTLSRHISLLFIASGRSSGLHPVSSHSCCMYVRAGHPAFAWPYAGVHRSTSLMSLSLLVLYVWFI